MNLFIVLSPLQLICAQSARDRFCAGEQSQLIVIHRCESDEAGALQVKSVLDGNWSRIQVFSEHRLRGPKRSLFRIAWLLKIGAARKWAKGKVFLGEPRISFFRALGLIFGKSVTALDDGASSLNLIRERQSVAQRWANGMPEIYSLFVTPEIAEASQGAMVRHELNPTYDAVPTARLPEVAFIGQPLSETGFMSLDEELLLITRQRPAEAGFAYLAHRNDRPHKHQRLAELGIRVLSFDWPVELVFAAAAEKPRTVISCFSTALFTLSRMSPDIKFIAVRPDFGTQSPEKREQQNRFTTGCGYVYDSMANWSINTKTEAIYTAEHMN